MGFIIIDPLKMKINELLSKGEFHPFSEAILRYGSPEDIGLLIDKCKSTTPGSDQYYFIDFTPFVRGIELLPRFIDSINDANTNKRPVIMLSSIKNIRDLKLASLSMV